MEKIKAIFLDYTGTMVREDGDDTKKLIDFFMTNSDLNQPTEAVSMVWRLVKKYEMDSYLDSFLTEDEIVDEIIRVCEEKYHLHGDFAYLHATWQESWIHAPLFDDVRPFFEQCPYPIYVITNDGERYLRKSMEEKGLAPAGLISAETVKAYKPHKEIFEEALKVAGCDKNEVVHIGDSVQSDIVGAENAGIKGILLNRRNETIDSGIISANDLMEVLKMIR